MMITPKYLSVLKNELAAKGSSLAEGKATLQTHIQFRGELAKAYETFQTADLKKLNDIIAAILINNMIFCLCAGQIKTSRRAFYGA